MGNQIIFLSFILVLNSLQGLQAAVQYDVTNNEANTPGGAIFTNQIGVEYTRQTLESASAFIWQTFGQTNEADRKNVQMVRVIVEDTSRNLDVPAYKTGNEIHLNTKYIASYSGDVKREITGVLYHEVTHIWQWNGNGERNIVG
uniref:basic secretory family protein n=1 Tax=Escherichia coli TaxID=562 RepID=UPI0020109E01